MWLVIFAMFVNVDSKFPEFVTAAQTAITSTAIF